MLYFSKSRVWSGSGANTDFVMLPAPGNATADNPTIIESGHNLGVSRTSWIISRASIANFLLWAIIADHPPFSKLPIYSILLGIHNHGVIS